jgi:thiol-disulfide isomerase/thioredoxin
MSSFSRALRSLASRTLPIAAFAIAAFALAGCEIQRKSQAPAAARPESTARAMSAAGAPPVLDLSPERIPALIARPGARATLVNVWATWCEPCREEFPGLLRAARSHQRDGLRLILISTDFAEQRSAALQFLSQLGVTDTSYLKSGDDMSFINSLSPRWTGALPATFVYDAGGRLIEYWEGKAEEARFEHAIVGALHPHSSREGSKP